MAITIKIGSEPEKKVVTPKEIIDLKVLKNLNDDVMIFDHEDVTIVIQPRPRKLQHTPKTLIPTTATEHRTAFSSFL